MNVRRVEVTALIFAAWVAQPPAWGQCEASREQASNATANAKYGTACDISAGRAIVGAPNAGDLGLEVGSAYILRFDPTGWVEEAVLTPSDGGAGDQFGASVAIDGDLAAVGAPKANGLTGAVYLYRRSGTSWEFEFKLTAFDGTFNTEFGNAVAVENNRVVVGRFRSNEIDTGQGGQSGSAYVYVRSGLTWMLETKLMADNAADRDQFGSTVSISGEWVLVGAPVARIPSIPQTTGVGSVYAFRLENNTWVQKQRLNAESPVNNQKFGQSLALLGDRAAIGDRSNNGQFAYIFQVGDGVWSQKARLKGDDTATSDQFGYSVALSDSFLLVSARSDDDDGSSSGSVYVFRDVGLGQNWNQERKLTASDAGASDLFGNCVAMVLEHVVIGATQESLNRFGAAYFFARTLGDDCNFNLSNDECDLHADPGLDTNQNGTIDTCECATDNECGDGLSCTLDVCDVQSKRCVFTVSAGFCAIAGFCRNDGAPNPANNCEVCDHAQNPNGWSNVASGTACSPGDHDNNLCTDDVCLNGTCAHPDSAAGTACGSSNTTDCDDADSCDGSGQCVENRKADGTTCTSDGLFCTGIERCQSGFCESPGDPCFNEPERITCDEMSGMCVICLTDADCTDGNECTLDQCIAGECSNPNAPADTSCGDPSNTDCTNPDSCNGSGVCLLNHAPNLSSCASDGLFCNGSERCFDGLCVPSNVDPCLNLPATPTCDEVNKQCVFCLTDAECDDGNECTDDLCDGQGLCVNTVVAGRACGDQTDDACTDPDTCDAGGLCQVNHAADGAPCPSDDLFCSGAESCLGGLCVSSGDPCVAGTLCNEVQDKCDCTSDGPCGDGVFCNGVEVCDNGTCADGPDPCSGQTSKCREDNDTCVACLANADCNDSLFCSGTETCVNNACFATGNPCTSQGRTCNESQDRCDCNDNGDCADDLFCNGVEVCVGGTCSPGTAACPSGEQCDEVRDRCLQCLTAADCSDGDPCTLDRCPDGRCTHTLLEACRDNDLDGVENNDDDCPGTPSGLTVDENGCADLQRDSDRDGVSDDRDDCSNTPPNAGIDESGCAASQRDQDGDGVSDQVDQCPETVAGASVDQSGCADAQRDDDGDGVLNGVDNCPDTPEDDPVDVAGCGPSQLDSDADGVADQIDLCPSTPIGTVTDEFGCPVIVPPAGHENDNGNTNNNDNSDEPPPGQPNPNPNPCGLLGAIHLTFLWMGLAAMRRSNKRSHSRSA